MGRSEGEIETDFSKLWLIFPSLCKSVPNSSPALPIDHQALRGRYSCDLKSLKSERGTVARVRGRHWLVRVRSRMRLLQYVAYSRSKGTSSATWFTVCLVVVVRGLWIRMMWEKREEGGDESEPAGLIQLELDSVLASLKVSVSGSELLVRSQPRTNFLQISQLLLHPIHFTCRSNIARRPIIFSCITLTSREVLGNPRHRSISTFIAFNSQIPCPTDRHLSELSVSDRSLSFTTSSSYSAPSPSYRLPIVISHIPFFSLSHDPYAIPFLP